MEIIISSLKNTISTRSNSDASESSSPWEKRLKGLAEEYEIFKALNMAGNVGKKLDKIPEKNLENWANSRKLWQH